MQVGRGKYIELRSKYRLFLLTNFGLHNIPVVFEIFPLLTCINFNLLVYQTTKIHNTKSNNITLMCMRSITLNILILIKKLLYIINNRYGEIICAKYDSSSMINVCTACPADGVGLPAKVIWLTTFFLEKKVIFVWLLCRLPAGQPRS